MILEYDINILYQKLNVLTDLIPENKWTSDYFEHVLFIRSKGEVIYMISETDLEQINNLWAEHAG